jgi:hypothetical protein
MRTEDGVAGDHEIQPYHTGYLLPFSDNSRNSRNCLNSVLSPQHSALFYSRNGIIT